MFDDTANDMFLNSVPSLGWPTKSQTHSRINLKNPN